MRGNPAKLGALIAEVVYTDEPPLRLIAGSDVLGCPILLLESRALEFKTWSSESIKTDFETTS